MAFLGRRAVLAIAVGSVVSAAASASSIDEARRIYAEGKEILKAARAPGGDVVKGSHAAIAKFERAAALLGEPRDGTPEAELLQDINSMIFWTRRTTPMDMSELTGGTSGTTRPESRPPTTGPASRAELAKLAREAPAALARAETYARAHPDDYMSCAARFFEVADRYKDLHDIAFRAITRAQEFQRLADGKEAGGGSEAALAALPRDVRLVHQGDREYAAKRFDEAAARYREAISIKATPERHRKVGHAHFSRAQAFREEYTRAYLAASKAYSVAMARKDKAAAALAADQARAAGTIANRARDAYLEAEVAFQKARRMSAGNIDLDSEVHIALANLIRRKSSSKRKAADMFRKILLTYHDKLADDQDRTLYALAETFAGPETVASVRKTLARKTEAKGPRASGGDGGDGEAAEKPLKELSDKELRAEYLELKDRLKRDELKLKSAQLSGRFDRELLERVNAGRKRVESIKAEASRRGLR